MDAGLAGVVGAAVGVIGGLGSGFIAFLSQNAQQRRQQTIDREHRLEQSRREAYLVCVETSKHMTAAWWKLANCILSDDRPAELCQQYAQEAQHVWVAFTKTADAVCIAGPNEMAEAVQSLREAMWRMDRAGTSWYECVRSGDNVDLDSCEEEFRAAEAARTQQGFVFLAAARRALMAEH
ncbi:hypothetical protein AB0M39_01670 [Streptomyces sp. NPDC051907]|uniref:hypothetical protein n=1 Tax=Streptomyces sp. NPDC051907 TaxID=3155284 RepID=UPI003436E96B